MNKNSSFHQYYFFFSSQIVRLKYDISYKTMYWGSCGEGAKQHLVLLILILPTPVHADS